MADRKLLTLVQRLHRRTLTGQLPWTETSTEGVYEAAFGGLTLTIEARPDRDYPDSPDYFVRILNIDGRLVEEFSNNDLSPLASEGEPHPYKLLSEIHVSARRTAMGVERALNMLLDELGDDQP